MRVSFQGTRLNSLPLHSHAGAFCSATRRPIGHLAGPPRVPVQGCPVQWRPWLTTCVSCMSHHSALSLPFLGKPGQGRPCLATSTARSTQLQLWTVAAPQAAQLAHLRASSRAV